MPPTEPRPRSSTSKELERELVVWRREMRRARVTARLLGALLLALIVIIVAGGLTFPLALGTAFVLVLLVSAVGLIRRGRRLEPGASSQSPSS